MALRKISKLFLLFLLPAALSAQDKDSLRSYGKLNGEWRTYYMATINRDSLKDFQALATGGYVRYTHFFRDRFELGGAVYTSFNLNITDITDKDPTTGNISRYESGLFDLNDLNDKAIIIPGELYARYNWKNGHVKAGRMKIGTPFINGQDGRMIPTLIQGAYVQQKINNQLEVQFGYYNAISPRSTGEFFSIGESIGQYPTGRNSDGNASGYKDATQSDFMLVTDLTWKPLLQFRVRIVDYVVDNVFHSIYMNPSWTIKKGDRSTIIQAEWTHENRIGEGGNEDESSRYFTDNHANVLGIQLSTKRKATWKIAYNRITNDGRFLFPREWGREFLFTFQKRERSEGLRDAHALLASVTYPLQIGKDVLQGEFSAGRHWTPPFNDPAANKYAMPGYTHFNLDLSYQSHKFRNLFPELLITHKALNDENVNNPGAIINKVDLWHFSLIVNYRF